MSRVEITRADALTYWSLWSSADRRQAERLLDEVESIHGGVTYYLPGSGYSVGVNAGRRSLDEPARVAALDAGRLRHWKGAARELEVIPLENHSPITSRGSSRHRPTPSPPAVCPNCFIAMPRTGVCEECG